MSRPYDSPPSTSPDRSASYFDQTLDTSPTVSGGVGFGHGEGHEFASLTEATSEPSQAPGCAAELEQQTAGQLAIPAQQASAAPPQLQEASLSAGLDTQQVEGDGPQHGEDEAQLADVQPAQVTQRNGSSQWLDSMTTAAGADVGPRSEAAAAATPAAGSGQAGEPSTGSPQLPTAAAAAAGAAHAHAGAAGKGAAEARPTAADDTRPPVPVLSVVEQVAAAPAATQVAGQPLPVPEGRLGLQHLRLQARSSPSSRLPSSPLAQVPLASMASLPDLEEGLQLSQHFAATSQQLQADMDALKLSIETLDFGGLEAVPEATIALQQTALVTFPGQTPQQNTDAEVQALLKSQRQAVVVSGSQDLSSFLTGLRSKYAFQDEGSTEIAEAALQPGPPRPHPESVQQRQVWSPAQPSRALAAAAGPGLPGPSGMHQPPVLQVQTQAPTAQVQALPAAPEASGSRGAGPISQQDWQCLSQALRDNGFAGLPLAQPAGGSGQALLQGLYEACSSVLKHYDRRSQLVKELLSAADLARERETREEGHVKKLTRERDAAVKVARDRAAQSEQSVKEAAQRQSRTAAAMRRLEADVGRLSSQVTQLELTNRQQEQELGRAQQSASVLDRDRSTTERGAQAALQERLRLESEHTRLQQMVSDLEQANRAKEREVGSLSEAASQSDRAREAAEQQADKGRRATQQLEGEVRRLQRYVHQLEAANRVKEHELHHIHRARSVSERESLVSQEGADAARGATLRLQGELRQLQTRLARMQQQQRAKDQELQQASAGASLTGRDAAHAEAAARDQRNKLAAEVQRLQTQLSELEQASRTKEQQIQEWMETASVSSRGTDVAEKEASRARESVRRLEAEVQRLSTHLSQAQAAARTKDQEVQELMETASQSDRGLEAAERQAAETKQQLQRVEAEVSRLHGYIAQLDHASRAKEATIQQLKERLADGVARAERLARRDAEAYARLRGAHLANRGNPHGRGASGAMSAAARELRPTEIVGMYESHKEALEAELAGLKAEVHTLHDQLREAENRARRAAGTTPFPRLPDATASERLAHAEGAAAEAQQALTAANSSAAEAARAASRRVADAEHRADMLAEENAALILELDARPTGKQHKSLQRQVDILERRLSEAKMQTQGAGGEAEAGEVDVSLKVLGASQLTTRERMRRDQELHRLGLTAVACIPRGVLVDLLQDVAIALEVPDATTVPAAVAKLVRVVASLPRLEAFVGQVCEMVFHQGHAFVPDAFAAESPADIPAVLGAWVQALRALQQAQDIQGALVQLLQSRVGCGQQQPAATADELVPAVRHLVEFERHSLAAADTIAAAKDIVHTQPDVLLHRFVAQFQHLFDCPRLEGVLPAMNQVYVAYMEGRNFQRSLGDLLGLPSGASIGACLQRIRQLLDRHGQALDLQDEYLRSAEQNKENAGSPGRGRQGRWPDVEIRVSGRQRRPLAPRDKQLAAEQGSPAAKAFRGLQDPLADPAMKEHLNATSKLMNVLGVSTPQQVVAQAEKLIARLQRLDEVIPRYQNIMTELLDVLRVRGMDEVLPAVRAALARSS